MSQVAKKRTWVRRNPKLSFKGELTNPVGNPTLEVLLKEEDVPKACKDLIDHMATGKSFESFASKLNVGKSTLYNYLKRFPELLEAKEIGQSKSLEKWEELGLEGIRGELKNFNATTYIFTMKNKHNWQDKKEIEATHNINVFDMRDISEQDYIMSLKADKFIVAEAEDIEEKEEKDA